MNPWLFDMSVGTMAWLWQEVICPSWLSLSTVPLVLVGYRLLGRQRRAGWWFVIVSQAGLVAIGLANRQYGLVGVLLLTWQAFQNWRRAGRAAEAAA